MESGNKRIKKLARIFFLMAILVRFFALILYFNWSPKMGQYLYIDDWKYEEYARIYASICDQAVDFSAFKVTDKIMGGVKVAQLFFRFNAVLYALWPSITFLKISNIIVSSFVIYPLVYLTNELSSYRAAKISALIYTFFPYYIFMSIFLFKDNMILLFFITSLYMIAHYYNTGKLDVLKYLLINSPLPWLRDGLFLFSFLLLAWVVFWKQNNTVKKWVLVSVPLLFVISFVAFEDTIRLLIGRINFYMSHGRVEGAGIMLIRIDNLSQIYKLPLTWFFSLILPINTSWKITRWSDVLMILNYFNFFLMVAYCGYILNSRKTKIQKIFFVPIFLLHLVIVTLVIHIPRHYYFLHFYIIIFSSIHLSGIRTNDELIEYLFSVVSSQTLFMLLTVI